MSKRGVFSNNHSDFSFLSQCNGQNTLTSVLCTTSKDVCFSASLS
jgi:hypothetical protein